MTVPSGIRRILRPAGAVRSRRLALVRYGAGALLVAQAVAALVYIGTGIPGALSYGYDYGYGYGYGGGGGPSATLTVIKHVINDSSGIAVAGDFTIAIQGVTVQTGSAEFPGQESPGTTVTVDTGNYDVTEINGPPDYSATYSTDCSGILADGDSKTCTITNNDVPTVGHVLRKATGGGRVGSLLFTFNVSTDRNGTVTGTCTIKDPPTNDTFTCDTITSLVVSPPHATFSGTGTLNGTTTTFVIDATDNAEPGVGSDTFNIVTGTGFARGGTITEGNIQIHQD